MSNFRNLPDDEFEVFGQMTLNHDQGHPPRIVAALKRKGLIVENKVPVGTGMYVIRYPVPILVHIEWCNWCATSKPKKGKDDAQPAPDPRQMTIDIP